MKDSATDTYLDVPFSPKIGSMSQSERGQEAVLIATWRLLAENGYASVTIDAIAARARVSKTTIYRRWRGKREIVVELLERISMTGGDHLDTGSLRRDLELAIGRLLAASARIHPVVDGILAAAHHDETLRLAVRKAVSSWRSSETGIIRRAVTRGDLPSGLDEDIAVDLVASTIWFRVMVGTDDELAELPSKLVDPVLRAWGAKQPNSLTATQ